MIDVMLNAGQFREAARLSVYFFNLLHIYPRWDRSQLGSLTLHDVEGILFWIATLPVLNREQICLSVVVMMFSASSLR